MTIHLLACFAALAALAHAADPPKTWIDPDTGHRIVRLTDEPGSASLYFNQNGYTADGQKMVYTTPNGISVFNLKTHETKPVVDYYGPKLVHQIDSSEHPVKVLRQILDVVVRL